MLIQADSISPAMFAHGFYDFLRFAFEATFATSAIALALWIFVIRRAHAPGKKSAQTADPVAEKVG